MEDSSKHGLFGVHLILDAYECDSEVLDDREALLQLLTDITETMDMTMICEPQVVSVDACGEKDPGGHSGFVMISESHISFHTFPKRRFVTLDIYTCRIDADTDKITAELKKFFKTDNVDAQVIQRGTRYPMSDE